MPPRGVVQVDYSFLSDDWLKELEEKFAERDWQKSDSASRWGQSVQLRNFIRTCWVWFPEGVNHNLSIDQYIDHWEIEACRHTSEQEGQYKAFVAMSSASRPTPVMIRDVLVLAGFLEKK
jgi:hypothetical protein